VKRHLFTGLALLMLAPAASVAAAFDYGLKARRLADGVYAFIGHTEDFDTVNGGNIANAAFIVAPGG
jgi:uncharacterized sulfatase